LVSLPADSRHEKIPHSNRATGCPIFNSCILTEQLEHNTTKQGTFQAFFYKKAASLSSGKIIDTGQFMA